MHHRCAVLLVGTLWSTALLAAPPSPDAHVHGMAELKVAIDGARLEIDLESPLENLLGFEHAPRTEQQRAAVRAMATRLRQAQTLFVPTPAAQCRLMAVRLESAALPAALLGEAPPKASEVAKDADGHADLDASFTFQCAAPASLKGMEVALMKAFSGLRRLSVSLAGPKGQSATVLTPGKRTVSW